ncbi:hypothetical protein VNI00_017438 [Paramarasmius palmivorus]|uniref:FAD-binding domain-containing protein n=1 Tax=Paramarasmius palmivorus TaxID=297713 RepID=A0AAW0B780_9AGAR
MSHIPSHRLNTLLMPVGITPGRSSPSPVSPNPPAEADTARTSSPDADNAATFNQKSRSAQVLQASLVLALSLLRNNIPVRIIEKQPHLRTPGQRGSGIQPRTLEHYHFLGILPAILAQGGRAGTFQLHTAPEGDAPIKMFDMHEMLEATPDRPFINPVVLGQQPHEAILRDVLQLEYNTQIELGVELLSLSQDSSKVTVKLSKSTGEIEEAEYDYVVGADGAHSVVRKELGCTFLGETREGDRFVIGDIYVKSGLEGRFCRSWGTNADRQINLLTFEKHTDRYTFICGGKNLDYDTMSSNREAWIQTFQDVTGRRDVEFGDVIWMGVWRANIRMADKFGEGRVFIVGDAAHVHPPTGAQGMNSSVQDSINLSWKLTLVLRHLSPTSLLTSYTAERLPVIASMLGKTTDLLNSTYKTDTLGRGFELRQFGVNYRGSSIVLSGGEEGGDGVDPYRSGLDGVLKAGDRAPDAPNLQVQGEETSFSLFGVFKPTHHTILVFTPSPGVSLDLSLQKDVVKTLVIYPRDGDAEREGVVDTAGYAYKHYGFGVDGEKGQEKGGVVIVRPDGYVGAILRGEVEEGVKRYFGKVFL